MTLAITHISTLASYQINEELEGNARWVTANLKWLIDWRTASSNSIGPGISKVGWSGWADILGAGEVLNRLVCATGSSRFRDRSMEYGVLSGSGGLKSRCLEIKDSLSCGATMEIAGYSRRRRATVTSRSRYHPKGQCRAGLAAARDSEGWKVCLQKRKVTDNFFGS
jgi:hypothetical protein